MGEVNLTRPAILFPPLCDMARKRKQPPKRRSSKGKSPKEKPPKEKPPTSFESLYFTTSQPASYGGLATFAKTLPIKRRKAGEAWLREQDTYNLHRPVRRKFPRGQIITSGIDQQFQADLIDVGRYAGQNDGTRYILTVIDCFSRYAWARPLKRKDGLAVASALTDIFARGRIPKYIQSDRGKEFLNKQVTEVLEKYNVRFFTSHNDDIKCAIVERFNRTLMEKLHRYFTKNNTRSYVDQLQNIMNSYNKTRHSSTGCAPANISPQNQEEVWLRLFAKPAKYEKRRFVKGDYVRISKARHAFAKGYVGRWSEELFRIERVNNTLPVTYELKDWNGEDITGVFYTEELVKAKPPEFWSVEAVLDRRKRAGKVEYLVKWNGYSDAFNSWVGESDIKDI